MAFWVHVEKGYTIFIVYFSSFKSLESLARLLKKVLKSCETFKIQDFANARWDNPKIMYQLTFLTLNFSKLNNIELKNIPKSRTKLKTLTLKNKGQWKKINIKKRFLKLLDKARIFTLKAELPKVNS